MLKNKKKLKKIIIVFILIIFAIFFISFIYSKLFGHFSNSSVINYLNEEYPNDSFEIISKERVLRIKRKYSRECNAEVELNEWTVKSKDTGVIFNVIESYGSNSFFCTYHGLIDNYFETYFELFIKKLNDNRIIIDKGNVEDNETKKYAFNYIIIYYDDFDSYDEMVDFIFNIIQKANQDNEMKKLLNYHLNSNGLQIGSTIEFKIYKNKNDYEYKFFNYNYRNSNPINSKQELIEKLNDIIK